MKRFWSALLLLFVVLSAVPAIAPAAPADRYAEGQVWEYRTRPQDAGSLLRIQRIEDGGPLGKIYHISIVGIFIGKSTTSTVLMHSPVSRVTLDASVTRLSSETRDWPDVNPGIDQWRAANGGVFDIPVADIVAMIDRASGENAPPVGGNDAT